MGGCLKSEPDSLKYNAYLKLSSKNVEMMVLLVKQMALSVL